MKKIQSSKEMLSDQEWDIIERIKQIIPNAKNNIIDFLTDRQNRIDFYLVFKAILDSKIDLVSIKNLIDYFHENPEALDEDAIDGSIDSLIYSMDKNITEEEFDKIIDEFDPIKFMMLNEASFESLVNIFEMVVESSIGTVQIENILKVIMEGHGREKSPNAPEPIPLQPEIEDEFNVAASVNHRRKQKSGISKTEVRKFNLHSIKKKERS